MASLFSSPSTGRIVLVDPPTAYGKPVLMLAPPGAKLPPGRVHPVTASLVHGFIPLSKESERVAARALAAATAGYGEGFGFGVAVPAGGGGALTMAGLGVAVSAGGGALTVAGGAGQRAGSVVARAGDDLPGDLDGDQEVKRFFFSWFLVASLCYTVALYLVFASYVCFRLAFHYFPRQF